MSTAPLVSVSIDLDPLGCYYRIHALPGAPPPEVRHVILRRCLPRFADLFSRHGIKATFFVVGEDLGEDAEGRALLAALARDGHELANHTHRHPYDLTRLPPEQMADEVDRATQAIAACAGERPVGFRSPGYETTAPLLALLAERGYQYDSSAFPSAPYYLAKAAVMATLKLRGRRSGSILGSPCVLAAPLGPYQPSPTQAYARGSARIWELPMAVTPWLRLPVIGTSVITFPDWLRRRLVGAALRTPFFNFELHGIDLADAEGDGFPGDLIARQPDLRRPLAHKRAALEATLAECRAAGGRFQTLRQVAAGLGTA